MTVKKIVKLFCFNILFLTIIGCGEDFSVGGASLEGTGNGLPPPPGLSATPAHCDVDLTGA